MGTDAIGTRSLVGRNLDKSLTLASFTMRSLVGGRTTTLGIAELGNLLLVDERVGCGLLATIADVGRFIVVAGGSFRVVAEQSSVSQPRVLVSDILDQGLMKKRAK